MLEAQELRTLERKRLESALQFNPHDGDFGTAGDRVMSDKVVLAAKDHPECSWCKGPIIKGSANRVIREVYDGEITQSRFCQGCVEAMCSDVTEGGYGHFDARVSR